MKQPTTHEIPYDDSVLSPNRAPASSHRGIRTARMLLDAIPQGIDCSDRNAQLACIEQVATISEKNGLMKPLRKESPSAERDTGKIVLIVPMKHPFQGQANDDDLVSCQIGLFQYFTMMRRMGLQTPIFLEGQAPVAQDITLNIGGTPMKLLDSRTQKFLFENPEITGALLKQSGFPYFPFMTAGIQCVGMQSEQTKMMEQNMRSAHLPNLNRIVGTTRFTLDQLKILTQTAEAFANFFGQMEEDFVEVVARHADTAIPRLVVGYNHTNNLIEQLQSRGITSLIQAPIALPEPREQRSPTESMRYRKAKEILSALSK